MIRQSCAWCCILNKQPKASRQTRKTCMWEELMLIKYLLWVSVEHDWQVLVHGHQLGQRHRLEQFASTAVAEQIAQRPVWVAHPHQVLWTSDARLVLIHQPFSANVSANANRDIWPTALAICSLWYVWVDRVQLKSLVLLKSLLANNARGALCKISSYFFILGGKKYKVQELEFYWLVLTNWAILKFPKIH